MNTQLAKRLSKDLPRLLKAYRERQHPILADSWLAHTSLMQANTLADEPINLDLAGLGVASLLRWAISLTAHGDAESATLLHGFYVQHQTVEAVAERLAISTAAFHKVRQPKAVAILARTLAQLLARTPSQQPDLLDYLIEDRYTGLQPAEQRLARFAALLRTPAHVHWVQQVLALHPDDFSKMCSKLVILNLTHWHTDDGANTLSASAAAQNYWRKRLPADEAADWHRQAHAYYYEHKHYLEAAHHQLALNQPEFAAQLLVAQHSHILESDNAAELLRMIQCIRQEAVQPETYVALKLAEGKAAQAIGDIAQALAAYRIALSAETQPHIKAEACYRYANALEAQDIDGALAYYHRSIALYQSVEPANALLLRAHIDLAWLWLQARPDLDKAEQTLRAGDLLFQAHHPQAFALKADLHNAWARWFHQKGSALQGIERRQQALLAAYESGNPERIMKLAHNLGQDYRDAGQYAQAMQYLEMSLALALKTDNRVMEGMNQETLGGCSFFLRDYSAAIDRYYRAYDIFVALGHRDQQGWAAFDLCEAYLETGEIDRAWQKYTEAMRIANDLGLARLSAALAELPLAQQVLSRPATKRLQRRAQAIDYAQQQGHITNRAYRTLTGVSPKQATRDLAGWVQDGTLELAGQGRSITYRLTTHWRTR